MQYEQVTWYSERVHRDMTVRVYGHYGPAVIAFPCQNRGSDDWANNGMIDALAHLIEEGRMKLFCPDANDSDSYSLQTWDQGLKARNLEAYFQYVIEELLPFVYDKQGGYCLPYLVGSSSGGSHAANMFFRRPELFSGFIALSASFDMARFFDGYSDENVYNNSPVHYLANMDPGHPYIDIYNSKAMIACVGNGRFEHLVRYTYEWLAAIAEEKNIHIDFNFWDENSVHDWESWHYQMRLFLERLL